jgi:ABC-2 type transport system permease protein
MSAASDTLPAQATRRPTRPFYWSLRRELWENRAIYLAPLVVAAVVLAAFLYASKGLPHELRTAMSPAAAAPAAAAPVIAGRHTVQLTPAQKAEMALVIPYAAAAFAALATATIVGVFYALGALYGERRDRTVLFWKSLPVSDLTTVLSKACVALVVLPLVAIATALATQLVMLAWSSAVVGSAGFGVGDLWPRLHLSSIWMLVVYGFATMAVWWAPVAGWLLLVSAWARRMTFLWAVAPPAAVCLFERVAFGTTHAWDFLMHRLHGMGEGLRASPTGAGFDIDRLSPDPVGFVATPGVWGGLVFLAACLAACVWLRRRRDPI